MKCRSGKTHVPLICTRTCQSTVARLISLLWLVVNKVPRFLPAYPGWRSITSGLPDVTLVFIIHSPAQTPGAESAPLIGHSHSNFLPRGIYACIHVFMHLTSARTSRSVTHLVATPQSSRYIAQVRRRSEKWSRWLPETELVPKSVRWKLKREVGNIQYFMTDATPIFCGENIPCCTWVWHSGVHVGYVYISRGVPSCKTAKISSQLLRFLSISSAEPPQLTMLLPRFSKSLREMNLGSCNLLSFTTASNLHICPICHGYQWDVATAESIATERQNRHITTLRQRNEYP